MGSMYQSNDSDGVDEPEEPELRLGDALDGELSDLDIDSVEAVREVREE